MRTLGDLTWTESPVIKPVDYDTRVWMLFIFL